MNETDIFGKIPTRDRGDPQSENFDDAAHQFDRLLMHSGHYRIGCSCGWVFDGQAMDETIDRYVTHRVAALITVKGDRPQTGVEMIGVEMPDRPIEGDIHE